MTNSEAIKIAREKMFSAITLSETSTNAGIKAIHANKAEWLSKLICLAERGQKAILEDEKKAAGCEFCLNGEHLSTYDKYGNRLDLTHCPMCGCDLKKHPVNRHPSYPTKEKVQELRDLYPKGTRLELTGPMADQYTILTTGDQGTVEHVDDMGTIHMRWDSGSSLGIIPGQDNFRKI